MVSIYNFLSCILAYELAGLSDVYTGRLDSADIGQSCIWKPTTHYSNTAADPRNMRHPPLTQRSHWAPPGMPETRRSSLQAHGSRLPASNSLVSETAAELRRTASRSQMLPSIPRYSDAFEVPSDFDPDNWYERQFPATTTRREGDELSNLERLRSRIRNLEPPTASRYVAPLTHHVDRPGPPAQLRYDTASIHSSDQHGPSSPSRGGAVRHSYVRRAGATPSAEDPRLTRTLSAVGRRASLSSRSTGSSSTSSILPSSNDRSDQHSSPRHRLHSTHTDTARPRDLESHVDRLRAMTAVDRTQDELRSRARMRAAAADVGLFLSPSPPPARGRDSSLTAEPPRAATSSAYDSIDLSGYHPGPFRASLQRSLDLDRIRSRLNRRDSIDEPTPATSASTRTAVPPSLPPSRFDSNAIDLFMDRQPRASFGTATEVCCSNCMACTLTDQRCSTRNRPVPILTSISLISSVKRDSVAAIFPSGMLCRLRRGMAIVTWIAKKFRMCVWKGSAGLRGDLVWKQCRPTPIRHCKISQWNRIRQDHTSVPQVLRCGVIPLAEVMQPKLAPFRLQHSSNPPQRITKRKSKNA